MNAHIPRSNLIALLASVPDGDCQITAREGSITVTASATTGAMQRWRSTRPADVQRPGAAIVSASMLATAARGAPESTVSISMPSGGRRLTVESGRVRHQIAIVDDGAEPLPPVAVDGFVCDAAALRAALLAVRPSIGPEGRHGINGVHVERIGDALAFRSTDAHRLSGSQCAATGTAEIPRSILLPALAVDGIARALDKRAGDATIGIGDGSVSLTIGDDRLSWSALDGEFPNYRAIIPRREGREITVSTEALRDALRRCAAVGHRDRPSVFTLADGEWTIAARTDEAEVSITVPCEATTGAERELGYNPAYLLDALDIVGGDTVTICAQHAMAATLVVGPDAGRLAVVMPMRVDK